MFPFRGILAVVILLSIAAVVCVDVPRSGDASPETSIIVADVVSDHGREVMRDLAPVKYEEQWRKEEVVNAFGHERAEIVLNGVWRFMPISNRGHGSPSAVEWGSIRVPGSWKDSGSIAMPGVLVAGAGRTWDEWRRRESVRALYERDVLIPADWRGRNILLELQRVSTDATVYVNGIESGRVSWPGGEVDITTAVTPGRVADLRILVVAASRSESVDRLRHVTEAVEGVSLGSVDSGGVIGDVLLRSRPAGPHIGDVFVQTSTRRQRIELAIELRKVARAGDVRVVARIMDRHGREARRLVESVVVEAAETQTVNVGWEWRNPVLWDLGKPNLYTARVEALGAGLADEHSQVFGFREFWIDGHRFVLNGKEIRLRPALAPEGYTGIGGTRELIRGALRGLLGTGFNVAMLWPWDAETRGTAHFRPVWAEQADDLGVLLIMGAGYMNKFVEGPDGRFQWDDPAQRREFENEVSRELRRYRNHPSIVMYASSGNFFGHDQDQNPRYLGRKGWIASETWNRRARAGYEGIGIMKTYDATRPVMMHEGAYVGDVFGIDTYLNMIPLQEREEWLTEWAATGDQPFMAVEFGTPLHASMMRGRGGFRSAVESEPWLTEFAAIYFGRAAYENESALYRRAIREKFTDRQRYRSWQNEAALDFSRNMQALQALFSRNTWRSWRTMGITGGMIPWADGHGWQSMASDKVELPYGSARRGTFPGSVARAELYWHANEGGWLQHPGGQAIAENDSATLAWIAGGAASPAEKTHNFRMGERVEKRVALLNDTRDQVGFSYRWDAWVAGRHISGDEGRGTILPGTTRFFSLNIGANVPSDGREHADKVDGRIVLEARIGSRRHRDEFEFRVFADRRESATGDVGRLLLFDPIGKTGSLLESLGYRTKAWQGEVASELLIVGREALSGDSKLPGDLERFVRRGGRVLLFAQQPDWFRKMLGLRVARHVSRRVFPVSKDHPVVRGLDDRDLRDWSGSGTLVEPYPANDAERAPAYGWHWGNRGSVSSASVEKPHLGSWRPILENEFDLAYSPLMELEYGKGRVILCTLDLEDRGSLDPAAERLTVQLIRYAVTAEGKPGKGGKVVFAGSRAERELLDSLGLEYEEATELRDDAALMLIGEGVDVGDRELRTFLDRGRTVLFMARRHRRAPLGVSLKRVTGFHGSVDVPNWEWTAGLSASDLRWRVDGAAWVIGSGADIGADGLLAFTRVGRGLAVFCQIDPSGLGADTETFLRFTRWRSTRALAQILANLGASFTGDRLVFQPRAGALRRPREKGGFYHRDYREDFDLGDDPYRYRRW